MAEEMDGLWRLGQVGMEFDPGIDGVDECKAVDRRRLCGDQERVIAASWELGDRV